MINWIKTTAAGRRFVGITILLCIAYYVLELVNHRAQMADFRVYYDAASALINGTQVYGISFGVSSGFFKYSPFAAMVFVPFALLPYQVASILFYGIIVFAIIWFVYKLDSVLSNLKLVNHERSTGLVLLFSMIFMADHLERELHLGNINLFLLIGSLLLYESMINGKEKTAGIFFAILLLFKPHFLILAPYFIWRKKITLLVSTLLGVVTGLIIPALFFGWNKNLELFKQWIGAIRDHNVELSESPNTIYGLVNESIFSGNAGNSIVLILLALTAVLFFILLLKNSKNKEQKGFDFIEFFVLVALIPNLAHTDTEHFMWSWPLIFYALSKLVSTPKRMWVPIVLMALAFVPYCLNSPDLVGRTLQHIFDEGLLGASNLVIVGVAVWWYFKKPTA